MNRSVDLDIVVPVSASVSSASYTALTPVRLANASEQIAQRIVNAIALGEFTAGDRLPRVQQLAARLKVNETSIREALQRLATEGYIEIRRGRNGGSFVLDTWRDAATDALQRALPTEAEALQHLIDLRGVVEPAIAAAAAQRRTNEEGAVIGAALQACAGAEAGCAACCATNHTLHTAIASATHNPYLVNLSLQLRGKVGIGCLTDSCSPELRSASLCQHAEIVEAILKGDPELAAHHAAQHVLLTEDALRLQPEHATPEPQTH